MCYHPSTSEAPSQAALPPNVHAIIPQHPVSTEALRIAQASLPQSIVNHSIRVFIYTTAILSNPPEATVSPIPFPILAPHVVFAACMLHDLGSTPAYDSDPERFEVCGADQCVKLLRRHGIDEAAIREAWLAITLHTSAKIAERVDGLVRALRLGVLADFSMYPTPELGGAGNGLATKEEVEAELPRLEAAKDLTEALIRQGLRLPEKVPDHSWAGGLIRARKADPNFKW